MGMVLGHHIPGRLGPAPAVDSCSFTVKSDDPTPEPFSTPGGSRRDVRFRFDGLRSWTHWTVSTGGNDTHQYDISPAWSFLQVNWTPNGNILRSTALNRSMTWHDNGNLLTFLARWFSSFRRIDTFDMSATPYDISSGLGPTHASFTGLANAGEYMARFSLDGFSLFIDGFATDMRRYNMTVAHDISTITGFDQLFNYGVFVGTTNTWDFSADHTRLYFAISGGTISSLDLTAPDDISAPFNLVTGPKTDLPSNLMVPRGLNIRADTGDIILLGDQNAQRIRCWAGGVAPTVDPDFSNVVLLLDFAGVDGATNITDLSPSGHTETFLGDAEVDLGRRALGENTVALDGTGDAVTFPDSADWDFGTGDFTVEIVMVALAAVGTDGLISTYDPPTTTNGWWLKLEAGDLRFGVADTVLIARAFTFVLGVEYHLAVSRVGTSLRMFILGVQQGATVVDSTNFTGSTRELAIGMLQAPALQPFTGNLGGVRVTKGVGRFTASFTPPVCFYPSLPVPPSPIIAAGGPSITKPTSTGIANVISAALVESGTTIIEPQSDTLLPPSATEAAGDRIFVYSTSIGGVLVDGTWEQLNTLPGNFVVFTKVAAGDATDDASLSGAPGSETNVGVKFTFKDIAGPGSWDFNAQGATRNSAQTTFNVRELNAFGIPAPSISIYCGLRLAAGLVAASGPGIFSDNLWTIPPTGGVILATKTQKTTVVTNTQWAAVNFNVQAVKTSYPDVGANWQGADPGVSHNVHSRGFRYDHD